MLFCVVLLVGAPALAAHVAVVSEHTTDTDFSSGTVQRAATISGSGDAASVDGVYPIGTRPADSADQTGTNGYGLEFTPNYATDSVTVTLSSNTQDVTEVALKSDGSTTLDTANVSGGEATLNASLSAGSTYYLVGSAEGASPVRGYLTSASPPYTSAALDITAGTTDGGSTTTSNAIYLFDTVSLNAGKYVSAGHAVDGASAGLTNLSLSGSASVRVTWQGSSGSGWQDIATNTYSTSGEKSAAVSGYDEYRTVVTFDLPSSSDSASLLSDSVTASTSGPSVNNSSASPQGGTTLTATPFTAEIDVSDPDFATQQGDNVTVEWFVDGTKQTTTYTQSNGTVSAELDAAGGDSTWHVVVTDSYADGSGDHTQTSDTFVFDAPSELEIRNASNPGELVQNAEVTVTFFGDDLVIDKTTTDGTISLDDLPLNQTLVVQADAPGHSGRTTIIEDVFEQNRVYLLNTSAVETVETRFTLNDGTGQFPEDQTTLYIERPLNVSGSTSYKVVSAGPFEVNGYTEALETGVRYRLRVENDQGDVRTVGAYTPTVSETVPLQIQGSGIDLTGETGFDWSAEYRNVSGNERIVFALADSENLTTNLEVSICEQGAAVGNSSACFANFSAAGPLGSVQFSQPLDANESNKTWVVRWTADRDGKTISGERVVGDPTRDIMPELGEDVKLGLSILVVCMTMLLFSRVNYVTGSITTSMVAGALWLMGWLPDTAGGAVAVTLLVGLAYKVSGGN